MNRVLNPKNQYKSAKATIKKPQIKRNALALVLLAFVAVAAMQAVQLGELLSEAETVSKDVSGIRAEQHLLRAQYTAYNNNLSYYFKGYDT